MEPKMKQPKTIFEQIVFGQEITNDNIVTLAENLSIMNAKIDAVLSMLSAPPVENKIKTEPDASGEVNIEQ